jgi:hypothetical protein
MSTSFANTIYLIVLTLVFFCLTIQEVDARTIDMHTRKVNDNFGNSYQQTTYTIDNRRPNGWDQLLGSSTDQAISFNSRRYFNVRVEGGDIIRDLNNQNHYLKTNMGGQVTQRCLCPGHGIPCHCN